jgi:hypothetical protein
MQHQRSEDDELTPLLIVERALTQTRAPYEAAGIPAELSFFR